MHGPAGAGVITYKKKCWHYIVYTLAVAAPLEHTDGHDTA